MKTKKTLFRNPPSVAALSLMLVVSFAFAQTTPIFAQNLQPRAKMEVAKLSDTAQPSPSGSTSDVVPATNESPGGTPSAVAQKLPLALVEELEVMKKRIAELESELRGKPAEKAAADAVSSPSDSESSSADSSSSTVTATADLSANAGSSSAQDNTAKPPAPKDVDPFSLYDYTWMNGNSRNTDTPLATKYFSPEFRADTNYTIDANHPADHSLGGSTETFRSGEVQVEQLSFGGDLRVGNVRGRVLTMFGMFATTTPRNDASPAVGQWDLRDAYRYISEAWGGYHFNVNYGLNVDAGIFVSYIGLFSYYNFDNWTYQPSYVSSNTPWFFNGLRIQYYPSAKLKIEPWFINGWQSYAKANGEPGLGGQILWRPNGWFSLVSNNYGFGHDAPGILDGGATTARSRIHTDNSVEVKFYDHPDRFLDKMAMSFTGDLGCESGGGVSCFGRPGSAPKQAFLGFMEYDRFWFAKDKYAITLGGGEMANPGLYLTLLPPINGADAISGTPYFTENPGQNAHMWDTTFTFDYMPAQFLTFRFETGYRHSDIPYWSGPEGLRLLVATTDHPQVSLAVEEPVQGPMIFPLRT